jgi:Na+/H+ antiporter NhaD/arsenite permease-like protein
VNSVWLAGGIFLITYALIVTERVDRTVSAVLGGMAMILLGVLSQDQAFHAIDWNVIFLLGGMMVIANVLRETGLFQWSAIQAIRLGKGDPFRILVILSTVIAVSSALLDNVTIVVLAAPVALFVASSLKVSPLPFLITGILASNIGGTATLVGDPPNILIGSAAGIDFLTFAANLAPISLLILIVFPGLSWFLFRKDLQAGQSHALDIEALEAGALITDRRLLNKALIVMAGVVVGFLAHGALHLEPATIAVAGATILLLWGRSDPHKVLRDVEWTTLVFFVGLCRVDDPRFLCRPIHHRGSGGRGGAHRASGRDGVAPDRRESCPDLDAIAVAVGYCFGHRGQYPLYGNHDSHRGESGTEHACPSSVVVACIRGLPGRQRHPGGGRCERGGG